MEDMNTYTQGFVRELQEIRGKSENTVLCYRRDLNQWLEYCAFRVIENPQNVSQMHLNEFLIRQEKQGKKPASVARMAATLRGFFQYLMDGRIIEYNPTVGMMAPKIQRKAPEKLAESEMTHFFEQLSGTSPKELRDCAMCYLMHETGMGVSELLGLNLEDVNLRFGAVIAKSINGTEHVYALGKQSDQAIQTYLKHGRKYLADEHGTQILFPSCTGGKMSRQGYWKMLQYYARQAGLTENMTAAKLKQRL